LLPQSLTNATRISELYFGEAARFLGDHATLNIFGGFLGQVCVDLSL
jgi:hypothetical protein